MNSGIEITIIRIFVLILASIDMIMTYKHLLRCKEIGIKNYSEIERNPLFLMCWNIFGDKNGSLIASIAILSLLLILSLLTNIYWNILYLLIYILAISNHVVITKKIKKLKMKKKNE